MNFIDIAIILGFILWTSWNGLRWRRAASQDLENYFLAGRSLKGWQAGLSMAATQFAADTPLLVVGLIATAGIFSLWRLWIYAIAFLLMGFLLGPCWRRAGVLTDAEFTSLRYSGRGVDLLRAVKAIYFGTIFNCAVLAMVLLAAIRLAEPLFPWHEWLPGAFFEPIKGFVKNMGWILVSGPSDSPTVWTRTADNILSLAGLILFTLFYSTTGGLRSVVQTDIAQFSLAIIATLFFSWWVVDKAGGIDTVVARLHTLGNDGLLNGIRPEEILAFTPSGAKDASFFLLLAIGLQWLIQMNADGTGYLAQRSMACRSDRDAKQAAVVFSFSQVWLRSLLWLPLGLGLIVLFPPDPNLAITAQIADREFIYVRAIAGLPVGIKGILLSGMLAALASTLDTHLNWGASYWTNDLYRGLFCQKLLKRVPSDRGLVRIARLSNILILGIALLILPRLGSIQKAWQMSLLLGAGMGVMLILRWIWWRITALGEIASIVTSLGLAPFLLWLIPEDKEAVRLLLMAFGSTTVGIIVSLYDGRFSLASLEEFYRKVEPPGFWGSFAEKTPEGTRASQARLVRGVTAALLSAFSLFCLLTGSGTWLVRGTPPQWFPWFGPWITLNLFIGVALIPVWWRLGFGDTRSNHEPLLSLSTKS